MREPGKPCLQLRSFSDRKRLGDTSRKSKKGLFAQVLYLGTEGKKGTLTRCVPTYGTRDRTMVAIRSLHQSPLSAERAGFSRNPPGKTHLPVSTQLLLKHSLHHFCLTSIPYGVRELRGEGTIGRYRPPALCALPSRGSTPSEVSPSMVIISMDSSILTADTYLSGYRRTMAETSPYYVSFGHLAGSTLPPVRPSPSTFPSTESFDEQLLLPLVVTPASLGRTLRHSTSAAFIVALSVLTERSCRERNFLPQALRTLSVPESFPLCG